MAKITLQDITGYESGAVQYADGSTWVGNWSSIDGLPREALGADVGTGDLTEAMEQVDVPVPSEALEAMHELELAESADPHADDCYSATYLPALDVTIVTCKEWH